jgi:CheY-like chemotaxis protein
MTRNTGRPKCVHTVDPCNKVALRGNLAMIQRKPQDPERVRRWAEHVLQAAERGAKLTAQLLAFSRAQKIELKPAAVSRLVAGMEDMLRRSLGPMVRVLVEFAPDDLGALADPTQLEMAVLNLAINARDAMPSGGDLTIATTMRKITRDPELPPGDYVEIRVSDTGTGMPPDVAARAFEPFFTTKDVGKGTGLGLSQVYGMVRRAGGTARIENRHPQGTSVTLLLRSTALPAAEAENSGAQEAPGPRRRRTVLVVDDDVDVRRVMVDWLEMLGCTVLIAEDGFAYLSTLHEEKPDLLLLDYAMPGITGAELAQVVRGRWPGLPIVFASGYSNTDVIEAAMGPGAMVLRKPFQLAELESMFDRALPGT